MVTKSGDMSYRSAGVKNTSSDNKNNVHGLKRNHGNGNRVPKSDSKQSSPYSSRGSSPSGSVRKSRSADERLDFMGKPLSSRGSESGSSDFLDHSTRKIVRNNTVPAIEDNINVCIRVRPLSSKEIKTGDDSIIQFPGDGQILVEAQPSSGQKAKLFTYNVVFEPHATQDDVLQYSGVKRLIEMAVEGYSCTAFCYGQTGSGKTHTLTGPPGLFDGSTDPSSAQHGLVFRSFLYLFKLLQERRDFHFVLKASFLEIYNEKVIDLLNLGTTRKPLAVRWSKKHRGFFVENLFTVDCEELDDLLAVLEEGMRNRSVGRHNMNDYSSRSHTILTVHITSEQAVSEAGVFISKQGKINFVDLAGSEMTKKTHSEGKTLEEANNINKSLMVLGYCIASLSDSKKKAGHIPYRDSKLTKLLADSLAGNGVTLMIACISPARSNLSETINTLRYAARAKRIRTKPVVVMDPREALILSLKREVSALQNENDHLKTLLNLGSDTGPHTIDEKTETGMILHEARVLPTPPRVDLEKLVDLDGQELADLVKHYMTENDALRKENAELFSTRDILIRDQELVCRENERLLKKLEDVNSVCCRSPIIPARPTFSAEMLNSSVNGDAESLSSATNIWSNPMHDNGRLSSSKSKIQNERLPDAIEKELSKRQIGKSISNFGDSISHKLQQHSSDNTKDQSSPMSSTSRDRVTSSDKKKYNTTLSKSSDSPEANKQSPAKQEGSTSVSCDVMSSLSNTSSHASNTDHSFSFNIKQFSDYEDDDDNKDVRSPSLSGSQDSSDRLNRLSAAPTLPLDESMKDNEDVFGSIVSLREDIP